MLHFELDPVTRKAVCLDCRMRQAEQENARLLRVPLDMVKPSSGPVAAVQDDFRRTQGTP